VIRDSSVMPLTVVKALSRFTKEVPPGAG